VEVHLPGVRGSGRGGDLHGDADEHEELQAEVHPPLLAEGAADRLWGIWPEELHLRVRGRRGDEREGSGSVPVC
jgi:hypothetical protein